MIRPVTPGRDSSPASPVVAGCLAGSAQRSSWCWPWARCPPVDVVHLVEVDVVGLQSFQRTVTCVPDVACGEERVVGPLAHRAVELRRDDDLLAPAAALGEPATDDLLGDAFALLPPVDVGRVEEVDALVDGAIHDLVRIGLLGDGTEVHRAEDES